MCAHFQHSARVNKLDAAANKVVVVEADKQDKRFS